jgi:hypothetical protein
MSFRGPRDRVLLVQLKPGRLDSRSRFVARADDSTPSVFSINSEDAVRIAKLLIGACAAVVLVIVASISAYAQDKTT